MTFTDTMEVLAHLIYTLNRKRMARCLHTINELKKATGLSYDKCRAAVKNLEKVGILKETGKDSSTWGRSATIYQFDPDWHRRYRDDEDGSKEP